MSLRKTLFLSAVLLGGCGSLYNEEQTKKYRIVSSWNAVICDTDNRTEAYEKAHNLTLMGRCLSHKPIYFVIEKR